MLTDCGQLIIIIDISIKINNIMFKNKLLVERFELLIGVFKS